MAASPEQHWRRLHGLDQCFIRIPSISVTSGTPPDVPPIPGTRTGSHSLRSEKFRKQNGIFRNPYQSASGAGVEGLPPSGLIGPPLGGCGGWLVVVEGRGVLLGLLVLGSVFMPPVCQPGRPLGVTQAFRSASVSLFGVVPVRPHAHLDVQRHAQAGRALHQFLHQGGDLVRLPFRGLDQQFVVDLEQQACPQGAQALV